MAIACSFCPTEWQMHFGSYSGSIDVSYAGLKITHCFECAVYIARVNGGRKSIRHTIRNFECTFETVGGNHGDDRAENFFLCDTHLPMCISEDSGFEEVAVVQSA